jgi:hypothetical protein
MFHQSTLEALKELVQAAGLQHPNDLTAHHIVRRLTDTDVRLLAHLLMNIAPNALLADDISALPNVFKHYWPMASAERFAPAP